MVQLVQVVQSVLFELFVVDGYLLEQVLLADLLDLIHVLHVEGRTGAAHTRHLVALQVEGLLVVLHHVDGGDEEQTDEAEEADQEGDEEEGVGEGLVVGEELGVDDGSSYVDTQDC